MLSQPQWKHALDYITYPYNHYYELIQILDNTDSYMIQLCFYMFHFHKDGVHIHRHLQSETKLYARIYFYRYLLKWCLCTQWQYSKPVTYITFLIYTSDFFSIMWNLLGTCRKTLHMTLIFHLYFKRYCKDQNKYICSTMKHSFYFP